MRVSNTHYYVLGIIHLTFSSVLFIVGIGGEFELGEWVSGEFIVTTNLDWLKYLIIALGILFVLSAYGLFKRKKWGVKLTIISDILFFGGVITVLLPLILSSWYILILLVMYAFELYKLHENAEE